MDPWGLGRCRERVSRKVWAAPVPESELLGMLWDQLVNGRDLSIQGPHCHSVWVSYPGPIPSPADASGISPMVSVTPVARHVKSLLARLEHLQPAPLG